MVIFIDDLDRCLPEVALEVLEALKLYLNIPGLLFVAGIDRTVIDQVVIKHHKGQGVTDPDKALRYLDKLFQVELNIQPSDTQAKGFLDQRIKTLNTLTEGNWAAGLDNFAEHPQANDLFRKNVESILTLLGEDNPRTFNRIINSLLVRAGGARAIVEEDDSDNKANLRFAQGVQSFLLEQLFEAFIQPESPANLLHSQPHRDWLEALSSARSNNSTDSLFQHQDEVQLISGPLFG